MTDRQTDMPQWGVPCCLPCRSSLDWWTDTQTDRQRQTYHSEESFAVYHVDLTASFFLGQTERETDRQTDRQRQTYHSEESFAVYHVDLPGTDGQIHRQTDRQRDRQIETDIPQWGVLCSLPCRSSWTDGQIHRQTEGYTDRQTDRGTDR